MIFIMLKFERNEQKFLLTASQFNSVFAELIKHANIDKFGWQKIQNIYFDNDLNTVVWRSIESEGFKEKLRIRTYGNDTSGNKAYIELKVKNKGITYKRRIEIDQKDLRPFCENKEIKCTHDKQIACEIKEFIAHHKAYPKFFVGYERLALSCEETDLRITIDKDLQSCPCGLDINNIIPEPYFEEPMYIMEIKSCNGIPLWLTSVLTENNVCKESFSKYGKTFVRHQRHDGRKYA